MATRHRTRFAIPAALLGALMTSCGDDDPPEPADFVSPVYAQSCQFVDCGPNGECTQQPGNPPECVCAGAYDGDLCNVCAAGHHFDTLGECVADRYCADEDVDPCLPFGTCNDDDGVVRCDCPVGYNGARCELCASGHARSATGECLQLFITSDGISGAVPSGCGATLCSGHGRCMNDTDEAGCECHPGYAGAQCERCAADFVRRRDRCIPKQDDLGACEGRQAFDLEKGFAADPDTCFSSEDPTVGEVTLSSLDGSGTVWLCGASTRYGVPSDHVTLEAGTTAPARITFAQPIVALSFEYGARAYGGGDTLSLELSADDGVVGELDTARYEHGVLQYQFDPPTEIFSIRSLNSTSEEIAIDQLEYRVAGCTEDAP